VGCFTPGIDVWDVDLVNVLEPAAVLGGYESEEEEGTGGTAGRGGKQKKAKSKTKKKRPKLRLKDGSHTDAVMALCWNPLQREYLASGSADTTVKIWDIESAHCARTFAHHSGKVQSVAWHHAEESALLTGSFDRTVQVLDVRLPEAPAHTAFGVGADVESVLWGIGPLEGRVLAATEDGQVSIFDRRVAGAPLATFQAHGAAVSAICLSADVPGLLVTGSVDKTLKVWDARPCAAGKAAVPELVYERMSKAGAIFGSALCPVQGGHPSASPFFLAYAGAKGVLVVADLAVESEMVRTRFSGAASTESAVVIEKRAARVVSAAKNRDFNAARRQARSAKMKDESGSDDSDASGSNSSSSDWETDSGKEDGDTL
jgi:periodic tryptophan protein 1